MKEVAIFLVGAIIGGMVIAAGAGRFDLFVALVTGIAAGLVFIIGLGAFLKWLEKPRPNQ